MREEIILLLSNKKTNNLSLEEITQKLSTNKEKIQEVLQNLMHEGIVYHNKSDKYILVANTSLKKGIIKVTKRKGPIVVFPDKSELLLEKNSHTKVLNNDIVLVEPYYKSGKAQLVKILKRNSEGYIGEIIREGKTYKVISPDKEEFVLKGEYEEGTIVLVNKATNQIKKIIGHKKDKDILFKKVLTENGFPIEFSSEYLKELEEIPTTLSEELITKEKRNGMYDLRNIPFITIDCSNTRDMDDSITYKDNTLYIAIAFLPYFIKDNSSIFNESVNRGTSVYSPKTANHMLHSKISNGICSLNPNEDRISLTLIVKLDEYKNIKAYELAPCIIKSRMKTSYEDVNVFLEDNIIIPKYQEYIDILSITYAIAMKLKKKMLNEGFLELTSSEVSFIFDKSNNIIDINKRHEGKGEELIEFNMILYNLILIDYFKKHKLPFMPRNHDKPNREKLLNWYNLVRERGYKVPNKKDISTENISTILSLYKESKERVVLDDLAIKSQSKAYYGEESIGHYALGLEDYSTFTSPIRRLADFINQYIYYDSILYGDNYAREKWLPKMPYLAKIATDSERRADKVQRIMNDIEKAEYMASFIGSKWTGIISEVGQNYIKVLLPNMAYGKVYISSSNYKLGNNGFSLLSNDGREKILVGDSINVTLTKVNKDTGEIILIRESTREKKSENVKEIKKKVKVK